MTRQWTILLSGAAAAALLGAGGGASAQRVTGNTVTGNTAPDIVVTGDRAGLLERRPSGAVMGLTKPLIETPRAASLVSATTIQRYGIQTINDLVAVSPNSYTASFYGVPGELDIRGTLADNYFLGFKLVENRGTYVTPIGDASQIDVVRGPPSPIYGPGKVGGFLDFIPKSARSEDLTHPVGEVDVTGGAYGKADINAQFGAPADIGLAHGGIYAYGEYDSGGSFYEGIHPEHETGAVSASYSLPDNWSVSADVMVLNARGDVQTPGWNRLTQALVDNGTYVTGRNTTLQASPGVGYLTPNQASPGAFGPYPGNYSAVGAGLFAAYFGFPPSLPSAFQLNSAGAGGTVTLNPRNVYVSPQDFSKTFTPTVVLGVTKDLTPTDTIKLQLFYNGLENQRFVSYGFPAWFRANAFEARLTDDFKLGDADSFLKADTVTGLSFHYYQGRDMQSYDSGLIALDRRDLSVGPTANDTLCDPFAAGVTNDAVPANCIGWETDVHSRQRDTGAFFTTDISLGDRLDLVVGARHDDYQVTSSDTGILYSYDYAGPPGKDVSATQGATSYSFSLTYKLGWGLMPYFTSAKDNTPEVQQAGDLQPGQIAGGDFLSQSDLTEAGIKFQLLNHTLVGAVDAYRQDRSDLAGFNSVSERTRSTGVELEVRYLATQNVSFTLTGASQHTEVIGPDGGTYYIPAYAVCGQNPACELGSWGGAYLVYNFDSLPGRAGNYSLSSIPHGVFSLYGNYISDPYDWGRAGATIGATYVTKTSGTIQDAIIYRAYTLVNASAFYQRGPYEASVNIDNLFDTFYVTPNSDPTYVNVAAIPGVGREWRITLKRKF